MTYLDGGPYEPPLGDCAIYSETTVRVLFLYSSMPWFLFVVMCFSAGNRKAANIAFNLNLTRQAYIIQTCTLGCSFPMFSMFSSTCLIILHHSLLRCLAEDYEEDEKPLPEDLGEMAPPIPKEDD